jgi:RNA polymerase sigma-70 factor, ECF subfamily
VTSQQAISLERERPSTNPELEAVFRLHYSRITKLIARITKDPGRAEELAVDVFLRLRSSRIEDDHSASGWLSRTAVRLALDELRQQERRGRLSRFIASFRSQPNPEEILYSKDQRDSVMGILLGLKRRDAELLMLRAEGLSYEELAQVLTINLASVGKLLSRAQQNFRKEYLKRHGKAD